MNKNIYIGETIEEKENTPFKNYTKEDWILYFIEQYGQIDGAHHKSWVLDMVARILNDCPIEIKKASWSNGNVEWRVSVEIKSTKYLVWVEEMKGEKDENGDFEYSYDDGCPP